MGNPTRNTARLLSMTRRGATFYERRRGDGFEVIGLIFDSGRGPAEPVVKTLARPRPQVSVPDDARARRLWADGPGFPSYPRVLLIDRDGFLRWDGGTEDLEKRITSLLELPRGGK
jgi:hypothetical protein